MTSPTVSNTDHIPGRLRAAFRFVVFSLSGRRPSRGVPIVGSGWRRCLENAGKHLEELEKEHIEELNRVLSRDDRGHTPLWSEQLSKSKHLGD